MVQLVFWWVAGVVSHGSWDLKIHAFGRVGVEVHPYRRSGSGVVEVGVGLHHGLEAHGQEEGAGCSVKKGRLKGVGEVPCPSQAPVSSDVRNCVSVEAQGQIHW